MLGILGPGAIFVQGKKLFWAYKNFYARGSSVNRKTQTLNRAEKGSFSFLVL